MHMYAHSHTHHMPTQVVEKKGDQDEKMLSTKIAWLLGKGSLKDYESVRETEITDFRISMMDKCRRAIEQRNGFSWEEKVMYCYPPDLEGTAETTQLVDDRLSETVSNDVFVHVGVPAVHTTTYIIIVHKCTPPIFHKHSTPLLGSTFVYYTCIVYMYVYYWWWLSVTIV